MSTTMTTPPTPTATATDDGLARRKAKLAEDARALAAAHKFRDEQNAHTDRHHGRPHTPAPAFDEAAYVEQQLRNEQAAAEAEERRLKMLQIPPLNPAPDGPPPVPAGVLGQAITGIRARAQKDVDGARRVYRECVGKLAGDEALTQKEIDKFAEAVGVLEYGEDEIARDVAEVKLHHAQAEAVATARARSAQLTVELKAAQADVERIEQELTRARERPRQIMNEQINVEMTASRAQDRVRRKPWLYAG